MNTHSDADIGFGDAHYNLAIYIANRPPIDDYPKLNKLTPIKPAELSYIVSRCSNHWRKVFNVYAKFLHTLQITAADTHPAFCNRHIERWQDYRDRQLLQQECCEALLFSPPNLLRENTVHIIAGKTYASDLSLDVDLQWLDSYFAVNREKRLIVSPYLDYRQLSNERIQQLADIVVSCL